MSGGSHACSRYLPESTNDSIQLFVANDSFVVSNLPMISNYTTLESFPAFSVVQFSDFDVPKGLAAIKYKVVSKCTGDMQDAVALVLEMMCQRTNYKDDVEIEDFVVNFDSMVL
jgi:hypothetical protein